MKGVIRGMGHVARLPYAAVACALLAACGSTTPARQTQATVPDTTIPPANSYAIPPHITAAYVQRVLNALEAVQGRATAEIVSSRSLTTPAVNQLKAIFTNDVFVDQVNLWISQIPGGLAAYKVPTGQVKDEVQHLLSVNRACIFAAVTRDFSAVTRVPPAMHTTYFQLVPLPAGADPTHINPTPWLIAELGFQSNRGSPTDPCAVAS